MGTDERDVNDKPKTRTKLKLVGIGVGLLPIILIGSCLDYYLPHTRKVKLVGVEVKRMDSGDAKKGEPRSRDVRFIQAREPSGTEPIVFRNEDTGWGWPPYFKFDSGTVAAHARGIVKETPEATVLVTYYGWRFEPFSWYPNAVELEVVEPDSSHFPLFNTVFFVLLASGLSYLSYRVIRWRRRRRLTGSEE